MKKSVYLYLFCLGFSSMVFILFSKIFPFYYEQNDDIFMILISSGRYTGTPDYHLVYMSSIYGLFLNKLYEITSEIEWYTLVLSFIHILSFSIIIWKVLKKKISLISKFVFLLFFTCVEIYMILKFQYTTTTALMTVAGILLFIEDKKVIVNLGLALICISSLLRFNSFGLIVLITLPFVVSIFFRKHTKKNIFIYALTAAFLIIGFKFIDYKTYSNNDWAYYYEYNQLRQRINDNPNFIEFRDVNNIDSELLSKRFSDSQVLTKEELLKIYHDIDKVSFKGKLLHLASPRAFKNIYTLFSIIFLALLCVILILKENKYNKLTIGVSYLIFLTILFFIPLNLTLQYRVLISAILGLMAPLLYFYNDNIKKPTKFLFWMLLTGLTLCITLNTIRVYQYTKLKYPSFLEQESLVNQYFEQKDKVLAIYSGQFDIELLPPFEVNQYLKDKKLLIFSWLSSSPFNANKDNHKYLLEDNVAIFVKKEDVKEAEFLLKNAINKNYNLKVKKSVLLSSENYQILKFHVIE